MHDLPLSLYSCKQVKTLDETATHQYSLLPFKLMNRAAHAALGVLQHHWHKVHSVAVVCGRGNNGGDGYLLASLAKAKGFQVNVYDVAPEDYTHRSRETQQARDEWVDNGGKVLPIPSTFKEELIVDALLGTGARFPITENFTQAIEAINRSNKPVFALDIPSGLNGDTGVAQGAVVKADLTLTFIAIKLGLVSHQGNDVVGTLLLDHLGIEEAVIDKLEPVAHRIDYNNLKAFFPQRALSANKGDAGHVLIIGAAEPQFGGAVCLAGEAALRSGAGLVSAIVAPHSLVRTSRAPAELMITAYTSPAEAKTLFERANALVLGPGLCLDAWGEAWFYHVLAQSKPMVIDADGLNWLAKFPQKTPHAVLTPHPKEAARLLETDVATIQHNRVESAKALQQKFDGVVVLKGAGTVVVDTQKQVFILGGGYPSLAVGGTGDVLSGIIGALLAQNVPPSEAARLAVCVHALAAQSQQKQGVLGMIASDLFPTIRALLNGHKDVK